ncbi:hypothetical protein ACWGII_30890 [Streptomyces sp. NPDC054855]
MSSKTTKNNAGAKRGGLPEDAALDAFGLDAPTVQAAFAPRSPAAPARPTAPDDDTGQGPAGETAPHSLPPEPRREMASATPAGAAPVPIPVPPVSSAGNDATQCTIMVHLQVRARFSHYQTTLKAQTGWEPTNAVVVRRAFLQAKKQELWGDLLQRARQRQHPVSDEDLDPDGLFGEVPNRRVDRGSIKENTQQSFRPSKQELAVYDAFATAHGFDNRSDFLNAVLDAFLPELPSSRRAGR